jgi:SAM-dependent methyltransferase
MGWKPMATPYTNEFYAEFREGAQRSARVVVPLVMELAEPKSVVDFGCGTGAWLSVFREAGVARIHGVEGAPMSPELLFVDPSCIEILDLSKPCRLGLDFDLVCSLEVAEHVAPGSAAGFVESLVSHGPVVLFSAAVPRQRGDGHVNEQWPDYWAKLFATHGYEAIDCVRPVIWNNADVEVWYRQNILVFGKTSEFNRYPRLDAKRHRTVTPALSLVHPELYRIKCEMYEDAQRNYVFWRAENDRCREYIAALEERSDRLGKDILQQRAYIEDLEKRHAEAAANSEALRRYILELEANLRVAGKPATRESL